MGIPNKTEALTTIIAIQTVLKDGKFYDGEIDGIWGRYSEQALQEAVRISKSTNEDSPIDEVATPRNHFKQDELTNINNMITLTKDGLEMIIFFETGGQPYYTRFLSSPSWPVAKRDWDNPQKNKSGVTIGVGYDMGQETTFEVDWKAHLSPEHFAALKTAVGLQRRPAQAKARELRNLGIKISWETAISVFVTRTLPTLAKQTFAAYTGIDKLHPNAQAAIMSMVFQWGPAIRLNAQRRIASAVLRRNYQEIAAALRSMKGFASSDTNRRETEAKYVLSAANLPTGNV